MKVKGVKFYDDIHTNINEIKGSMHCKKILLLLDGVTDKKQMEYFGTGEQKSFHPGSRILITARDPNLLKVLKVDDKYIVKGLSPNEALQLFCHHAFGREEPKQGYEEMSKSLIHYAGGHPLALKRLGSYLSDKSKDHWHKLLDQLVRSPYLDCVDGVSSSPSLPLQSVGPYGGHGGGAYDDGTYTGIRQISVLGCLVHSFEHGGHPDGKIFMIKFDYPNEYLASISGHIRDYHIPIVIQSLKFHTNIKEYGPFGYEEGQSFHFPQVNGGRIIGFHGKCGSHLDSIGAHLGPISRAYPFEAFGPCGGDKGENIWDDGRYTDVREIVVGFDSTINFISILYDKYGRPIGPFMHGTKRGGKTYRYLTSILGYTREVSGITILHSLTIHTNVKCYTPFGIAEGRYFSFPYTGGKIIGFHGRCDGPRLESIGAYYEPIPHTYPIKVLGPFGGAVKLVYPNEYITSFYGYINSNNNRSLINSLTFQTNKRIWGPIGKEEGKYFSLPSEAGKLSTHRALLKQAVSLQIGCSGGSPWDDGNHHANVRKIIIAFEPSREPIIESITFQYEEEDKDLWLSERHGGTTQGEIHVIDLYDLDEYLTSISGYIKSCISCPTVIRSLTFQSNKRTIGPFGDEKGVYFSSPTMGGKIIGFYGRSGNHLDAIGAYFEPISHLYPIKSIGPFGGLGGSAWDDDKFSGVREIEIMHDDIIHYIFFCYDKNGEPVCPGTRGANTRNGKAKVTKVRLDYPREYLTSISSYKRENYKPIIIHSLTFYSNKGKYGPFGKEIGRYFGYPLTRSKIIGFYGRSDLDLDSIGAYAEPISHLYPFKSLGPIGGQGGDPWDDGVHTDVRGIEIVVGSIIESIKVEYDYNGSSVQCSKHGGDHRDKHEVKLDYPKERLISISGYIRKTGGSPPTVTQSLKIHSTRCIYGPFGKEKGKKFCIPLNSTIGRIIGFYGRSRSHLDSIGACLEPYN
ncbi:hypothetical protein BT93_I0456 [Corymbia citriodora subsp. variegata]|nr:hypothetical protein BT93_I0456 [Corymbia citriodora subsp. variegata]